MSIQENIIKLTKTKLQRKRSTNVTYKLKLISLLLTLQQLLVYQKYLYPPGGGCIVSVCKERLRGARPAAGRAPAREGGARGGRARDV